MSYQVRYKRPWWPFWRKVRGVIGDSFYGWHRHLELTNGGMLLLPSQGLIMEFGPERAEEKRAKAGQAKQPRTTYPVQAGRLRLQVVEDYSEPTPTGHVALLLADDRRVELPPNLTISFGPERFAAIAKQMERESGGQVRVSP